MHPSEEVRSLVNQGVTSQVSEESGAGGLAQAVEPEPQNAYGSRAAAFPSSTEQPQRGCDKCGWPSATPGLGFCRPDWAGAICGNPFFSRL